MLSSNSSSGAQITPSPVILHYHLKACIVLKAISYIVSNYFSSFYTILDYQNKIKIITGAAGGIGQAVALEFAAAGAIIVMADIQIEQQETVASQIKSNGGQVYAYCCDVSNDESVSEFASSVLDNIGVPDILYNNAVFLRTGGILTVDLNTLRSEFDVNVLGYPRITQSFLPAMIIRGSGRIANTAPPNAFVPPQPVAEDVTYTESGFNITGNASDEWHKDFKKFFAKISRPAEDVAKLLVQDLKEEKYLVNAHPGFEKALQEWAQNDLDPHQDYLRCLNIHKDHPVITKAPRTGNDGALRGKKRPKVKGCYQCSRRRIDCDGGRPECQKCKAKGLTCDRLGIRYRFCDSVASRGKLAGKQVANLLSYNSPLIPHQMSEQDSSRPPTSALTLVSNQSSSELPASASVDLPRPQLDLSETVGTSRLALDDDQLDMNSFGGWVDRSLDHIDNETRSYLQYFSDFVAPVTGVIDAGFNGYRDLILPAAETDEVCLFGESLLNESDGVEFLLARSEDCLEFMRFCLELHPELEELMSDLFSMIGIARDIYIRRALHNSPPSETTPLLEQFRILSEKVDAHVDLVGRHLLAWSYFVVAAESTTPEHRTFFLQRLKQLHETTRCGNIRKAIHQVESLWAVQPVLRWTSALGGPTQALIM
ncbi:hypothetical protein FSARC_6696 [Fusarium sarcochroum]|uniref:Zn(2)-C6 fungal-type domain-containing protein n=1 Tax=Fusarium sarcochroum TaxID=1208366 RepID=A0A8H4TWX5_9HYPO|nr:hypothetical protein FSARC_6696 [Fusarium sarcochroum]